MSNLNERNQGIINEFRANAGKVGGPFAGRSLLLLHTCGAKSGNPVSTRLPASRMAIDS